MKVTRHTCPRCGIEHTREVLEPANMSEHIDTSIAKCCDVCKNTPEQKLLAALFNTGNEQEGR